MSFLLKKYAIWVKTIIVIIFCHLILSNKGFTQVTGDSKSILVNKENGFYLNPFYLKVISLFNDDLRYTTDGSIPTASSPIFPDSIYLDYLYNKENHISKIQSAPDEFWNPPHTNIEKAHVFRIRSFRDGISTGENLYLTYFIDSLYFVKYQLPTISIISDPIHFFDPETGIYVPGDFFDPKDPLLTGNYYQRGADWERPVYIQYFDQEKKLCLSQNAGIRIHGGVTRKLPQKTLRLYARDEYGLKEFDYPLLPGRSIDSYKRILLRSTMSSWNNSIISDIVAHQIIKDSDLDYQEYQPVLLFLNGEFWGIYTLRDRIDERYIAYLHQLDKDSIDIIEGTNANIVSGSNTSFLEMMEFIKTNDISIPENYYYVSSIIDIQNYIDYFIAEIYFKNYDWPGNNVKAWKSQKPGSKWKWIFYDIDGGYGDLYYNMFDHLMNEDESINWPNSPKSTLLFRKLLENKSFRERFIDSFSNWIQQVFISDQNTYIVHQIKNQYSSFIPMHIDRWNYPHSYETWENIIDQDIIHFLEKRPCNLENKIASFFQLEKFDGNCKLNTSLYTAEDFFPAPNPFMDSFFIYNQTSSETQIDVSIYSMDGQLVFKKQDIYLGNNQKYYIHSSSFSPGSYILKISNGKIIHTKKIVRI